MHHGFHQLNTACEKIKLELINIKDGPVCIQTHEIVKQLLQEKSNWTSRRSNSGLPRLIRSIARGAAGDNPSR